MSQRETGERRALLIGPRLFGYETSIVAELEREGFRTHFLDERPSNRAWVRAALRKAGGSLRMVTDRHFARALRDPANRGLDLVLVLKAEITPRWFLTELKRMNPGCRFVFYAYDSVSNSNHFLSQLDLFDQTFTFDRADAAAVAGLEYYPLFFGPEFRPGPTPEQRAIRMSFVGTLHSQRYRVLQAVLGQSGPSTVDRITLFVQARWYFFVSKYITRQFSEVPWSKVTFQPHTTVQTATIFADSRAVLDIHHPSQSGLSPRVFEVLATGAVLVTTNSSIRREPFYDDRHVLVIPADPDLIDSHELTTALDEMNFSGRPPAGFDRYSLSSWVVHMVGPARGDWSAIDRV